MKPRVTLRCGAASAQIAPAEGGCITAFALGGIDILRPAGPTPGDPRDTACFPLVPYSGRIRNGVFRFGGREVREALNFPPSPHAIHGHGWHWDWQVASQADDRLLIEYAYPATAGHWPVPYTARQQFSLDTSGSSAARLSVTISVRNDGDVSMPAGLGLHPYFPRTPGASVRASVESVWAMDEEVMPLRLEPLPDDHPLRTGLVPAETVLDNAFTGYDGVADIRWQDRGTRVLMRSAPELGHLVVYTPEGEDFFCVEPVSNGTDAFNAAARGDATTGMQVLSPGETFATTIEFDASIV